MKHFDTSKHHTFFKVLTATRASQAAMMVLNPGQSSSDEVENEHPYSEQWVFVISGTGSARIGHRTVALKKDSLLLIEKRERHRVTNTGQSPMVTLNFYSPPAYTPGGDLRSQ